MPSSVDPQLLAADTLRQWALDENLKQRVMNDPALAASARLVAGRYIAGESIEDAISYLLFNAARGHAYSVECVGESVRDRETAQHETEVFLRLIGQLRAAGLSATISFDLSHVGMLVDQGFGLDNALRIAAAADQAGSYVMISAEGSDRTDQVLGLYEQLSEEFPSTGITIQARLHRSFDDLERVIGRPGAIRLVKGAFFEPTSVAYSRESARTLDAYSAMAGSLISAHHRVNLATHDADLVGRLKAAFSDSLRSDFVEFEMLQGLGTKLLDGLRAEGFSTREYCVFGPEWWLYALNRIAEQPERVFLALADLG